MKNSCSNEGSTLKTSIFRLRLKKHANVITFIGALVVFATFVVREEIREDLKDLIYSVESAQAVFVTRQDTELLSEQINTLGTMSVNIAGAVITGNTKAEKWGGMYLQFNFRFFKIKGGLLMLDASLDNTDRLLLKLPSNAALRARVLNIKGELNSIEKLCNQAINENFPLPSDEDLDKFAEHLQTSYSIPLEVGNDQLVEKIRKLSVDALHKADQTILEQQHRFHVVTWISIFLFAVGWGLAGCGNTSP